MNEMLDQITYDQSSAAALIAEAMARARGGSILQISPSAQSSIHDAHTILQRYGVMSWGWYEVNSGTWNVHVADSDVAHAEKLLNEHGV